MRIYIIKVQSHIINNLFASDNSNLEKNLIQATNLRPCDPTGKADPYLNLVLGKTKICDKVNKIICQLNPIFGR